MAKNSAKIGLIIGLCVSGLMVIVVVGLALYFMLGGRAISAPTKATTDAGALDMIELRLDTAGLIATPGVGGGGAEKSYGEAFKLAWTVGDDKFLDICKRSRSPETDPVLKPVIEKILQAGDMGMGTDVVMDFDGGDFSIGPKNAWAMRDVLAAMGSATCKAGMSARADKKRELADQHFRAAFLFGKRLWDHGAYSTYKFGGLAVMGESLANMQSSSSKNWYSEPDKEARVKELYATYLDVSRRYGQKDRIMRSTAPKPGDLHNMAQNDKDPAWKLEGLMFLGFAKWTTGADERAGIQKYLEGKTTSSDSRTARKAKEAADFPQADRNLVR